MEKKTVDIQKCRECGLFFENIRQVPDTFCTEIALEIGIDAEKIDKSGSYSATANVVLSASDNPETVMTGVRRRIDWEFECLLNKHNLRFYVNDTCVSQCIAAAVRAVIAFCDENEYSDDIDSE